MQVHGGGLSRISHKDGRQTTSYVPRRGRVKNLKTLVTAETFTARCLRLIHKNFSFKGRMSDFGIKEVGTMDISWEDLG